MCSSLDIIYLPIYLPMACRTTARHKSRQTHRLVCELPDDLQSLRRQIGREHTDLYNTVLTIKSGRHFVYSKARQRWSKASPLNTEPCKASSQHTCSLGGSS